MPAQGGCTWPLDLNGAFAGKPVSELGGQGHPGRSEWRDSGATRRRSAVTLHDRALPRRRLELRHHRHGGRQEPEFSCVMPAPLSAATWPGREACKAATDAWSKLTGHEVIDLAQKFEGYGVEGVYTATV